MTDPSIDDDTEAREQVAPGTTDAKHQAPVHGHTGGVPSHKALSDIFAARQRRRDLEWPQAQATGNALRREQAAIRRSDRRTHLGDVTAHWATAARGATLTSAWSCLAGACADSETASQ
eukprot:scaffold1764_cov139-Isochrysis_galbana.AAC.2